MGRRQWHESGSKVWVFYEFDDDGVGFTDLSGFARELDRELGGVARVDNPMLMQGYPGLWRYRLVMFTHGWMEDLEDSLPLEVEYGGEVLRRVTVCIPHTSGSV